MSRPFSRTSRSSSPPALFAPSTTSSPPSPLSTTAPLPTLIDGAIGKWQQLGLSIRRTWLVALARHIQATSPASLSSVDAFSKAVYPFILSSSFNSVTRPTLPAGLASANRRRLPSQYVLLVLSSLNTLTPPSSYTSSASPSTRRLLKLTLTDGWQLVAAIEVRSGVVSLPAAGVRGYKVAVREVEVWRGVMLLDDTNTTFLGGDVREGDEQARLTVADGWDRKGTEEHKQPPRAASPFAQPSSLARPANNVTTSIPPTARQPPFIAPYAPPRLIQPVQPPPRFSASLPASLPPLEWATQCQPSDRRTSPPATDERKADSDVLTSVDDERMYEFYAAVEMDSEDALISLSAPAVPPSPPDVAHRQPSHSPPPPPPASAPFVRASSIRSTVADGSGLGVSVAAVSSSIFQSSSLLSSAVVDTRPASSFQSPTSSAAFRTSYTAPPPLHIPSHSSLATLPVTVQPPAAANIVFSIVARKKKARPDIDDPFYLPSTAVSQDEVEGAEEEEEDEEKDKAIAQAVAFEYEHRSTASEPPTLHTASSAVLVEKAVAGHVAMIEHDISGPEELAEAHHYWMQTEERDKQQQASDSLPPLEEVDDYYDTDTREQETAAVQQQQRATVDVIALDESDDELEAPSTGTSSSSPPVLTTTATTPAPAPLCTADCPFTYIHSLLRLLPHAAGPPRLYVIKGYLVTNSNSVTWPAFSMHVLVDDGSGSVECAMDGGLLEASVFCCTPQQLVAMSSEEQARLLKEAEKRVVLMEGFMLLRVAAGCLPVLLSVHEPDVATVAAVMEQRERERYGGDPTLQQRSQQ